MYKYFFTFLTFCLLSRIVSAQCASQVNAGDNVIICSDAAVQLFASGASSYSWKASASLSNTSIANPIATPSVSTTYRLAGTDQNGCESFDSIRVIVLSRPLLTISNSSVVGCNNSLVALEASGNGQFSWFPAQGLSSNNIHNPVLRITESRYYLVKLTDSNGCWAEDSLYVQMTQPPIINAGSDFTVNEEGKIPLSGTVANADGGVWSGGMGSYTNGDRQLNTTYMATDNEIKSGEIVLWLTSTGNRGCEAASDHVTVKIQKDPLQMLCAERQRNFDLGPARMTVCFNQPQHLKVNIFYKSVRWEAPVAIANGYTSIQITTGGQYKVTVQDTSGCIATDSVQVLYDDRLKDFKLQDTIRICFNNPESIDVAGGSFYKITWNAPSPILIPDKTINYKPTTQGVYKVNVATSTCHASESVLVLYRDSAHISPECQIRVPYIVHQIPEKIEAENFDKGAEGITYNDNEPQNLGGAYRNSGVDLYLKDNNFYIGNTMPAEWLEYTIDIAQEGLYDVAFNVSSQVDGGSFHLLINGKDPDGADSGTNRRIAASNILVPNIGEGVWTLVSKKVNFIKGSNVLRIVVDGGGFLIDNFDTKYVGTLTNFIEKNLDPQTTISIRSIAGQNKYELLNCITSATSISIRDVSGKFIQSLNPNVSPIIFGQDLPSGLYLISVVDNSGVRTGKLIVGN